MINDAEQTKSIVETGLMNIWLDMFTLCIALVIMFNMNIMLTLVAIAILPFYGYAVKKLYKRLRSFSRSRSQSLAEMQGYLNEHVNGISVVKSFTLESYEEEQFGDRNKKFLERAFALTRWNALTQSIINTLTEIAPLLVLLFGGYLVIEKQLTLGEFVAFYGYLDRLYGPLRRLVNSSTELTQASASLIGLWSCLSRSRKIQDLPGALTMKKVRGDIHFDQVSFRYGDEGDWILREIDLSIPQGHTVAFVGMSGGGKSSLVGCFARFYDAAGHDNDRRARYSERHAAKLAIQIGMVLQDNILFSGTVRDNIHVRNPAGRHEDEVIRQLARRTRMNSSYSCQTATIPRSGSAASSCPEGRSSGSPSPASS